MEKSTTKKRTRKPSAPKLTKDFEVITISPQQAKRWLEMDQPAWDNYRKTNSRVKGIVGNRKLRRPLVNKLKRAIEKGEWVFDGKSIKRTKEGMITDGRHRLTACVEAGIPIQTIVWNNATVESTKVTDDGASRSYTDMLEMWGFKNPTLAKNIITKVIQWAGTSYYTTTVSKNTNFSNVEFLKLAENNKNLIKSVLYAERFKKDNKHSTYIINPTIVGALHYICEGNNEMIDTLTSFIKSFMDNDGGKESITYKLGRVFLNYEKDRNVNKVPNGIWESYFITAFTSFFKGEKLKTISSRSTDPFMFNKGSRIRIIKAINDAVGYEAINMTSTLPRR